MNEKNTKRQQVQHLFWRAGFGASPQQVQEALRRPLRRLVRDLFDDSRTFTPLTPVTSPGEPARKELKEAFRNGQLDRDKLKERLRMNRESIRDLNLNWADRMASGKGALREKLALFWHGHFACRVQNARAMEQYAGVIREKALAPFGELLTAVSKSPAMLQFLNNQQNRKNAPNENFAREVMELFTLGRGNYTEKDIKEAARAFTGWGYNLEGDFVFRRAVHDEGEKTVLGQTGRFEGEDILKILLEKEATATFIVRKLYRYFVNEEADESLVRELATRYFRTGYDTAALLETIFTSDWFYEPRNIGCRIKSPVELMAGMQHSLAMSVEPRQPVLFVQKTLGQVLFYPPNVAGWPGGRTWIDSSSLLFRMKLPDYLLRSAEVNIRPKDDGDAATENLFKRKNRLFETTIDWAGFERAFAEVKDTDLPDELAAYLLQQPLGAKQRELVLKQVKKEGSRPEKIQSLTAAIMALPEYQLC
ncbi:DUF1800 domain-containing protein [Tellurirhabdus rosea]|uniref:DUF1800 domain-containing protein n=1 Tax=Tellurirhabdus rosea TaxID=2674997 RepID=UPI00225A67ED|nr:DUF1800 domain-containing protein [Tellurirhabdus rosea]